MKKEPAWGRNSLLQLNWVFDEFFVTPDLWQSVFRPRAVGVCPVLGPRGRELSTVVQLVVEETVPIVPGGLSAGRCADCGRLKYVPDNRGFFPKLTAEPVGSADDPRVRRDLKVNDVSRLPWFVKRYPPGLPRLALPRALPRTEIPLLTVMAGTARPREAPFKIADLARCLYLSAGVVRTIELYYGRHPLRAAGSADGWFPLELYVVVPAKPEGMPARVVASRGHAVVRPSGARPRAGGAWPKRRSSGTHCHWRPVAHWTAVPGARLSTCVLGRRNNAFPVPGAR